MTTAESKTSFRNRKFAKLASVVRIDMENLFLSKIDYLLTLADQFEASAQSSSTNLGFGNVSTTKYDVEIYSELESSSKSLVLKLYGDVHPYYQKLEERLTGLGGAKDAKGVLRAIKKEIEDGFIISQRDVLSAEIFTDFIEMAEYLVREKYKDAAAVIVGSILKERLRQLATANRLDITDPNSSRLN